MVEFACADGTAQFVFLFDYAFVANIIGNGQERQKNDGRN